MTLESTGRAPRRSHRLLRGLRAQLLLWTILPLAAVLIVLSLAGVTRHRQAMTGLVEDRDRGIAAAEANRLGREIAQQVAGLAHLATTSSVTPPNQPPDSSGGFSGGLAWLDAQGARVTAAPAARAWAESAAARQLAVRAAALGQTQYETDLSDAAGTRLLVAVPAASGAALVGALPVEALRLTEGNLLMAGEVPGAMFVLDQTGR